jgi:hypothetical protein
MSVDALLRRCGERGIALWAADGHLRYRVLDGSGLPADLAAALRTHKAELLRILAGRPEPRPGRCWSCGQPVLGWPAALYANCAGCALAGARRVLARLTGMAADVNGGAPAQEVGPQGVRP